MKQFVVTHEFADFRKGEVIADAATMADIKANHAAFVCQIEASSVAPAAPSAPVNTSPIPPSHTAPVSP